MEKDSGRQSRLSQAAPEEVSALSGFDPGREQQLQYIGDVIAHWIAWTEGEYRAEGLPVTPETHVMLDGYKNAPPSWPSIITLRRWLKVIRAASGTEARRAETVKQGSVHDGPTAEGGDAQPSGGE